MDCNHVICRRLFRVFLGMFIYLKIHKKIREEDFRSTIRVVGLALGAIILGTLASQWIAELIYR